MPGEKGKVTAKRIVHKPIIPPTVGQRVHSDLIDLRVQEDNGYKYILNYQDCFSKFIVLRALKTKSAVEVCDHLISIFCEHGAPHIFQTYNGGESTNNMLNMVLLTEWKRTRFVHGGIGNPQIKESLSELIKMLRSCSMPASNH